MSSGSQLTYTGAAIRRSKMEEKEGSDIKSWDLLVPSTNA